jgi:type IV pilus assembly protein PilB
MAKMMLGELLVGAGLVSEEQVLAALRSQRGSGMPLGHYLVRSGMLAETELVGVLSQQLSVPIVDLDTLSLHDDALKKVAPDYARANAIVPYRLDGRILMVATADPTRDEVLDHLRVATFCDAKFSLATPASIDRALDRAYPLRGGAPLAAGRDRDVGARAGGSGIEPRLAQLETAVAALIELLVGHQLAKREDFPALK